MMAVNGNASSDTVILQILDPIECSHGIAPGFAIEFVLFESDQYDPLVILLSGEYDRQDTVTFGIESLQLGIVDHRCSIVIREMVDLMEPVPLHTTAFTISIEIHDILIELPLHNLP